eukprot:gb/GEZJ01003750.1/.p1 GENE.gb/GEZJ01003750.1/~~gb/GEZJ01003750.1/.p1  ORF type:complete len:143 (+),score=10.79 gb/GEZJ01003750.1/:131-559(+)
MNALDATSSLTPLQLLCRACELASAALSATSSAASSSSPPPHMANPSPIVPSQPPVHNARRFACSVASCSKTFARVYNLKAHRRVHSREQPYCCSTCGRRFRWRSSLTSHAKFHRNTRVQTRHTSAALCVPVRVHTPQRSAT